MSCSSTIYTATIPAGASSLVLSAGLSGDHTYRWVITDRFGNTYTGEALTTADGKLTVPFATLPAGFSTIGTYQLQLTEPDGTPVGLTIDGAPYTQVCFTFRKVEPAGNLHEIPNVLL